MKRRREKLPKWRYEFDCRKCDNIREVHDPRKGRDGDYCIPCIEHMDSRRPSPIHADEKERVLRCECFTPIPEERRAKMRFPKLYECDPQKNTECNKRNCGNPCKHTTRKEFAREPSGSELLGKVVVITQMKKIPTACAYCKYYENMGGNRGRGSDGACTARGTLYATRGIRVSKERLDNCPLRIITGGRE